MPPAGHVAAFALTALVIIAIPGPSVMFVVGRALAYGRRAAVLTVVGNTLGEYVQVVAVAFGIGAVAERSVAVLTGLKMFGAAYLVYLGVKAIRDRRSLLAMLQPAESPSRRRFLLQGFVVGASNPKTVVFLVAILPLFVERGRGERPGPDSPARAGVLRHRSRLRQRLGPVRGNGTDLVRPIAQTPGADRRHRRPGHHRRRRQRGPHRAQGMIEESARQACRIPSLGLCAGTSPCFSGLEPEATAEEIEAAARQFVRKVSGLPTTSASTEAAFDKAVRAVALATTELLSELPAAPPTTADSPAPAPAERATAGFQSSRLRRNPITAAGVCPAKTWTSWSASAFPPVWMTATRLPGARERSCSKPASARAPAGSATLCVVAKRTRIASAAASSLTVSTRAAPCADDRDGLCIRYPASHPVDEGAGPTRW